MLNCQLTAVVVAQWNRVRSRTRTPNTLRRRDGVVRRRHVGSVLRWSIGRRKSAGKWLVSWTNLTVSFNPFFQKNEPLPPPSRSCFTPSRLSCRLTHYQGTGNSHTWQTTTGRAAEFVEAQPPKEHWCTTPVQVPNPLGSARSPPSRVDRRVDAHANATARRRVRLATTCPRACAFVHPLQTAKRVRRSASGTYARGVRSVLLV